MNLHKLRQLLKNDEGFKLDFKLELHLELESEKKELPIQQGDEGILFLV